MICCPASSPGLRTAPICNLYRMRAGAGDILAASRAMSADVGNLEPRDIYPDYLAPIVRNGAAGRELVLARWGLPSSSQALFNAASKRADSLRKKGREIDDDAFKELPKKEPDRGTTNVRNTTSRHWLRWLEPANRCLVPLTAFSEPDQVGDSLKPSGLLSPMISPSPSSPASRCGTGPACGRSGTASRPATCSAS